MVRWMPIAVLLLAFAGAPALAADALEAQVQEIERLAVTAHWRESNAKIEDLSSRLDALTPGQRDRVAFVRLRNLGLAGDERAALKGFADLLQQDLPTALRIRVYVTAINIAANVEDWSLAFGWLGEGLSYLPEAPAESAKLLGVASYLHTLVGETGKARELALRALRQVESGNDPRALCLVLSDVALAEDHARNFREAEGWRHRQIGACTRAGDLVFVANGKYGVGKMAARQGRHVEALEWARQALAEFEAAGFAAGAWSARLVVAESLIESNRGLDEAHALLTDTLQYYRAQTSDLAVAETGRLLARLAERRGDLVAAVAHFKEAMSASEAAERVAHERRLAYLQVEFDTRLKEQRITLLEAEKELATLQAIATQRRQLLLGAGMFGLLVTAILLLGLLHHSFRERRRYRWQSEHDSLTRLYNYQQVRKLGEAAFARARDTGRPFTAIVADIDLFKQVNDRHGHAAGDEALRSLGTWISEAVDGRGIAGRSGGDEFTILLETDAAEAEALLQRLRGRIEPITVFGHTFSFNISSGLCQADGRAVTLEQLIHQADRALYRAKHEGRDRVVRANDHAAVAPEPFADVPHRVVRKAREEGIRARMEPGISAEACLYADLGIDPGQHGVQSMEATQFLVHDRRPDTAGLVLLWQVALAGDLSCTRFHAEREGLQALVDKLLRWYPSEHEVILYEAARPPIETPRVERLPLRDLPTAHYEEDTTLVIPPLDSPADERPEARAA